MTIEKIQQKLIGNLLDQYEKSKTFMGTNQVTQTFSKKISVLFPKYSDDAEYDFFCEVNEAVKKLEKKGLVYSNFHKGTVIDKVCLRLENIALAYQFMGRVPRRQQQDICIDIWNKYEGVVALKAYITSQKNRLSLNKNIEYFDDEREEYENLLMVVTRLSENEEECFERDFSMALFHDSKKLENYKSKASSLLYTYGDYEEKDTVFEECGVVATPTYVCMKGNARLSIGEQIIDLTKFSGDIALSTNTIKELKSIEVLGKRVVTIENMTSFHDYGNFDDFVIYLGGFHNKVKRKFLMTLYSQNSLKEYRHFGDIDAGGFYILEHLKKKTGIPFLSMHMDIETLEKYKPMCKKLTENDEKRLKKVLEKIQMKGSEDFSQVIQYMLERKCKLEQEAVRE